MSGLHVFCVVPPAIRPTPGLEGIGGGSVEVLEAGAVAAWIQGMESVPEPSLEALRRHHAVVQAAAAAGPSCLPARFGSWEEDPERLERRLLERSPALVEGLRRVQGCVEFAVRVQEAGEEAGEAGSGDSRDVGGTEVGPGTAYLLGRADETRRMRERTERARRVSEAVEAVTREHLRAVRWEALPPGSGIVALAHLVPADEADAWGDAVRGWAEERRQEDVRVRVAGPWPPYSFTPEEGP